MYELCVKLMKNLNSTTVEIHGSSCIGQFLARVAVILTQT